MQPSSHGLVQQLTRRLSDAVGTVIVGKQEAVELALVALLSEGHVLIEDVPGIGKTTLAKALARSLNCSFQRIQFTPDLLPSDVTGLSIYNQKSGEFEFRPGPILAQVVLADEINRATPRTQAALLEIMEEHQVTVDGRTIAAPRPFIVLATQNPVELEGTFPLPEAQLDRFMLRINLGYPSEPEEHQILARFRQASPLDELLPVLSGDEVITLQKACRETYVAPDLEDYVVAIVRATRSNPAVELGASPRAALALYRTSQALAALRGRGYVIPDDVKWLAPHVLTHRLMLRSQTFLRGRNAEQVLQEVLNEVPAPVEAEEGLYRAP